MYTVVLERESHAFGDSVERAFAVSFRNKYAALHKAYDLLQQEADHVGVGTESMKDVRTVPEHEIEYTITETRTVVVEPAPEPEPEETPEEPTDEPTGESTENGTENESEPTGESESNPEESNEEPTTGEDTPEEPQVEPTEEPVDEPTDEPEPVEEPTEIEKEYVWNILVRESFTDTAGFKLNLFAHCEDNTEVVGTHRITVRVIPSEDCIDTSYNADKRYNFEHYDENLIRMRRRY